MCITSCVSYLYYHHHNLCNKIFWKVQVIVPPQSCMSFSRSRNIGISSINSRLACGFDI